MEKVNRRMSVPKEGIDTTALGQRGIADEQRSKFLELYRFMLTARRIDEIEVELVNSGEAFTHVPCAGHEGAAVLHLSMRDGDWLYGHYRDKALMLARGIPPEMFFNSLLCNAASDSAGRQMSPFLSDAGRHILSTNVPVGNHALHAVGVASVVKNGSAIVVCGMGDGTTQQGEVFEALAEAVRSELPVLFWIEDNGLSISTPTRGQTFHDLPGKRLSHFYGLPLHRLNGRDVAGCHPTVEKIVATMRGDRKPAIVLFAVDRLASHTNADDERVYRAPEEIEAVRRRGDPLAILADSLLGSGVARGELDRITAEVSAQVRDAAEQARRRADPDPEFLAARPLPADAMAADREYRGNAAAPRLTMVEAIREVLRRRMAADGRVTLFGEDIEDPKGDVFRVTRGLTRAFPGRVRNAPLSEATILGFSIGAALAGARPVAFIQFADFLPHACNQLLCELGSMYWRTRGTLECPVLVMIACGAYRPGLGPFHAQTLEALAAHVPGVDVLMPSAAGDAAGLLNAAFASGRPTLFFYPKIALNDRERTTSDDVARHWVPLGTARWLSRGDDLTMVSWGSTMPLCERVAAALATAGSAVDLIDLRSLMPWDRQGVCASVKRTRKLLVVHEDNQTCGFGAEVVATVCEAVAGSMSARRVTRPDTYVPSNFANQLEILPSFRRILGVAAEMLDLELSWDLPPREDGEWFPVEAQGSSPADQVVTVLTWKVKAGDAVRRGQLLADLEADKAVYDLAAPADGVVASVLVAEGQAVNIGTPLLQLRAVRGDGTRRRRTGEEPGTPRLQRRALPVATSSAAVPETRQPRAVGLSAVYTAKGTGILTNEELVRRFPAKTAQDIFKLTGIETRPCLGPQESALSLALAAARQALEREKLSLHDIHAIICSTSTPPLTTPSMACLVLHGLAGGQEAGFIAAHDVNAACSGYLYALSAGYDFLQTRPDARVLIVTAEVLTRMADPASFEMAILFGDAASATILHGASHLQGARMSLRPPVLAAKGEDGTILRLPAPGNGFIAMDGKRVFREAIRCMAAVLARACAEAGIRPDELSLIVPHQANSRIIEALRAKLRLPQERVFNHIRQHGNTSSSSIPLALAELGPMAPRTMIGLCVFGGGFTYGAALLETTQGGAGLTP